MNKIEIGGKSPREEFCSNFMQTVRKHVKHHHLIFTSPEIQTGSFVQELKGNYLEKQGTTGSPNKE